MNDFIQVRIKVLLYERIRIISETEEISPDQMVDHILRSYAERWEEMADQEDDSESFDDVESEED